MQITLKLYATLSEYLPEGAQQHRITLDIADEETAYGVIERYHVPREHAHLTVYI